LSDIFIHGKLMERIRRDGTCTVNTPDGNEATVYAAATGTTTVDNPVPYKTSRDALEGWVEVGEYALVAGGKTQYVDVNAGDNSSAAGSLSSLVDPALAAMNFPYNQINSIAVTGGDNVAIFVRVIPQAKITAAKIVTNSGSTAAATITKTVVGLYTTNGTTLTRVAASTTNLTSGLWDTTNTRYAQALVPATTVLNPGQVYYVGLLTDATTANVFQGYSKTANVVVPTTAEAPPAKYTLAAQTDLDATEAISGLTAGFDLVPWVAITA
jgi:hypothetical protein